jgi:hypothetical protein
MFPMVSLASRPGDDDIATSEYVRTVIGIGFYKTAHRQCRTSARLDVVTIDVPNTAVRFVL